MDSNSMQSSENHRGISRRSFIQLSVGTLTVLPAVAAGSYLIPAASDTAYADDIGTSDPIRIVAVSPRQVGLYVADQANGGNVPIPNAKVVVKSRYNGKVASKDTDPGGVALFDITELAEPERTDDGRLCFNGTIDVSINGYREFHMALARIVGGLAVSVPTRKLEPGVPYPRMVSFAEWDALYTKNTFVSVPGNSESHAFDIEIRNLDERATIKLYARGESKVYGKGTLSPSGSAGTATVTMSDVFLKAGASAALPIEGDYYMQIETSSTIYEFPIALNVTEGCADTFALDPDQDMPPCNSRTPSAPDIRIPDSIPLIGGQTFSMWTPMWPIVCVVDPFGFLYIAVSTPRVGYVSDNGSTNPKQWGKHPYASSKQQAESYAKSISDAVGDAYGAMSRGGFLKHAKFTKSFTVAASLRAVALAQWDWQKHTFGGNLEAVGIFDFAASFTEQFAVGPVPMFINLSFGLNVVAQGFGIGFATPDAFDFSKYHWDYTNTGITATFNFSASLSVGVGVAGVASIGARGNFVLTFFVGITMVPPGMDGKDLPHYYLKATGKAVVEVQLFLFKWTGTVYEFFNPKLYDNWTDDLGATGSYPYGIPGEYKLQGGNSLSLQQLASGDLVPVTDSALRQTCEVSLSSASSNGPLFDESTIEELAEGGGLVGAVFYPWEAGLKSTQDSLEILNAPRDPEGRPGVIRVDDRRGGIWPSIDQELMGNVFSDSRTKVVSFKERTATGEIGELGYVFRVASVDVNGVARTRIVFNMFWDGHYYQTGVVNFETGFSEIPRDDLYDYDFDVVASDDGKSFHLFMISGTRPHGDDTDIGEAFENLVFTYAELKPDLYGYAPISHTFSWQAHSFYSIAASNHAFCCPRIVYLGKEYSTDESFVAFSWLHRYTNDGSSPLFSPTAKATIGVGFACDPGVVLQRFEHTVGALGDGTGYDLALARGGWVRQGLFFDLFFAVRGESGTSGVRATVETIHENNLPRVQSTSSIADCDIKSHLTPWLGRTGFLASHDGNLVHVSLEGDAIFNIASLGVDDFRVDSFGIDPSGTFLYFPVNRHGAYEYEFDEKTGQPLDPDENATDNRIMAVKWHNGHWGDPYVLSNVTHSMENIASLGHAGSVMAFVSTSIRNFESSDAWLYFTAIPAVVAPTLLGVALDMPVVEAGTKAYFYLTIRNDGNMHITGAKADMRDESGKLVDTVDIVFSRETLQPSLWNPPVGFEEMDEDVALAITRRSGTTTDDDSKGRKIFTTRKAYADEADGTPDLLNVEQNYELAPGKTAVYEAALTVPKDWEGDRHVTIVLRDPTYVQSSAVPAEANPTIVTSALPTLVESQLSVTNDVEVDPNDTQDAPIKVRSKGSGTSGDQSGSGGSNTPKSSGTSGTSSASGSGVLAKTGDSSAFGIVGAALAAAGAGMVAYSARRAKLEREKENGEEH